MFKTPCDYDDAKADWILKCADFFEKDLKWKGLNLRPAFIRLLRTSLSLVTQEWFEKKLSSKESFKDILLDLNQYQKPWKNALSQFLGINYYKNKIKWFGHIFETNKKQKPLIAAFDRKHVDYLKRSKLFNTLDPLWLVDSPKMAKDVGLNNDDLIVPFEKQFKTSNSKFPFNQLHDLANKLNDSLLKIKPSCIFVVEGDSPYHSILAELGLKLDIPVYCFQWGFFHYNKLRTAFSEMCFSKFLSWGPIFEDQLRPFNAQQNFLSFGHLATPVFSKNANKIIFLSSGNSEMFTQFDHEMFLKLAISLAKKFPNRVIWRSHPNETLDKKITINLVKEKIHILDKKEVITNHFKDSVVAVGRSSSSLIDALYARVIPIIFDTTCLKKFPFPIADKGVGFEFKNFDEALKNITNLLNNRDRIQSVQSQINLTYASFFSDTKLYQKKNYIKKVCKINYNELYDNKQK